MVKNNLFTMIAIASLGTFACYGMDNSWSTYSTKNDRILQNNYNIDEFYIFDRKTDTKIFDSTTFPPGSLHIDEKNETDKLQTTKITNLPQPRPFKSGYGLAFLPEYSVLKFNLKLLSKDPQNVADLKTIARYLESENHLQKIKNEANSRYTFIRPIRTIAVSTQCKILQSNIDRSHQNVLDSAKRLVSQLPQSQQNQALKDLDKAVENAQYNRFQNKLYS